MVDFAIRAEHEEGLLRLKSIQCLSAASSAHPHDHHLAILGALPITRERGTGSELRQRLGYATIGRLLLSQILTLLGQRVNGLKARLEMRSPR